MDYNHTLGSLRPNKKKFKPIFFNYVLMENEPVTHFFEKKLLKLVV